MFLACSRERFWNQNYIIDVIWVVLYNPKLQNLKEDNGTSKIVMEMIKGGIPIESVILTYCADWSFAASFFRSINMFLNF